MCARNANQYKTPATNPKDKATLIRREELGGSLAMNRL
jgi:hypothetical protein